MTRVLFGLTCSPFLLLATIKHHLEQYKQTHPEICKIIEENLYMDDLIGGAETPKKALQITNDAIDIFADASMTLQKWSTNSPELQNEWEKQQAEQEKKVWHLSNSHLGNVKVLGLNWETNNDVFAFDFSALLRLLTSKVNTKREVLKIAARIYDPLGFLSPYTIIIKCLFQTLWEKGLEWDAPLPVDITQTWERWCEQIPCLQEIKIPRFLYKGSETGEVFHTEVHCFCDASERAYGACVYVRFGPNDTQMRTCFVTSKTRVAPLKKLCLPRLELMAALIGTRLVNHIKDVWKNQGTVSFYYWTDSSIVYHWIHGSLYKWKLFVVNRVREIKDLSDPVNWHHCPGKENPADLLTRGMEPEMLKMSQLWWHGPAWLSKEKSQWPSQKLRELQYNDMKGDILLLHVGLEEEEEKSCKISQYTELLDIRNYSNLNRVLRVTAWVMRFCNNTRNPKNTLRDALTAEEIHKAETFWVKEAQAAEFAREINALKNGKEIPSESKLKSLNVYLDDQSVLRMASRLQNPEFTYEQRHPVILSKGSTLVQLIITHYHTKVMHSGLSHTLSALREKYWIIQGRQEVKKILMKCLICQRFSAKPVETSTAPLPTDRTMETPPFTVTGVDFAGPVFVKGNSESAKAYIALFTCGTTRAVHLELVSRQDTPSFLLALRRFIARRGLCHTLYSDNSKTFKRADKEMKHLWASIKEKELKEFLGKSGIHWKYIVECAPWWGGMWERLVRSVKMCLKKTIGKALLSFEELETVLTEVEAVLNSRPITYVYNEAQEPVPLTPACFLTGHKICTLPAKNPLSEITTSSQTALTRRMIYRNTILTRFWNRWRNDYLLQLRSAHYRTSHGKSTIKANDVVLVKDDKLPRHMWKMGVVTEVYTGRDGVVRSCSIRLPRGQTIKRPVQLTYPLEIQ